MIDMKMVIKCSVQNAQHTEENPLDRYNDPYINYDKTTKNLSTNAENTLVWPKKGDSVE